MSKITMEDRFNAKKKTMKKRGYKIKNRFYIEAKYLEKFGFGIGTPIKYSFKGNTAFITPVEDSSKHVAKTTQKNGSIVPVIDIRGDEVESFFKSQSNVEVEILEGKIIFTVQEEVQQQDNVISFEKAKAERESQAKVSYSVSVNEFAKVVNSSVSSIHSLFHVNENDFKGNLANNLTQKAIKTLSLFSGCGTLDFAFKEQGFDIVWAIDRWENRALKDYHIQTYCFNVGDHIIMNDILQFNDELPEVDFVVAGVPCVRYSKLNSKFNFRDSVSLTDPLVEKTIDFIKLSKAKAFLIENVPDFVNAKQGLHRLKERLSEFEIVHKIIDATTLGSAQKRKRVFVYGQMYGIPQLELPSLVECTTVGKAWEGIEDAPQQDVYFTLTPKTLERAMHIPQGGNIMDCPVELRSPKKKFSNYCQRLSWNGFSPTLTHVGDEVFLHPFENHRTLTLRESARLFSLPDHFKFFGSKTAMFEMLKNGVDFKVGTFLAKTIKNQLQSILAKPALN